MNKYLILLLGCLVLLYSCQQATEKPQTTAEVPGTDAATLTLTAAQLKNTDVRLGKAETCMLPHIIKATGMVDVPPTATLSVHSAMAGQVSSHNVLPGSHVHKGQVLCSISHPDIIKLQQSYMEVRATLPQLEAEYERQKNLLADDAGAAKRVQQALAAWKTAQAQASGLEAQLNLIGINAQRVYASGQLKSSIEIRSSIDGFVKTVNVNPGAFINPADVLFEIVDTHHMHLELKVFEQDAHLLTEKQEVRFTSTALGTTMGKAHVFLSGKTFDGTTRTMNIHAHLDDEAQERQLMPGMFVQAEILSGAVATTCVPTAAVAFEEDKAYVFTVLKGGASPEFGRVLVQVKSRTDAQVSISMPAEAAGKDLAIQGAQNLMAAWQQKFAGEEE